MQIGMVGLGKMGMNMSRRLLGGGHQVAGFDRNAPKVQELQRQGASGARSLEELAKNLRPPRVLWVMLPAGDPTEETIRGLSQTLEKGDIIVDGGNSRYKDAIRRAAELERSGLRFADVGVSGGIWGLKEGYCLMVGGAKELFQYLEPVYKTLAPEDGYLYCGGPGAGHFVKMVHNGIEYGMMAAYGEGFEILNSSDYARDFDYAAISHLWNRGSVIRSWLLELCEAAFGKDPGLSSIAGYVVDSGEGRWTVEQAVETSVPAPVTALALFRRFRSRQPEAFSDKLIAALRNEFGGHAIKPEPAGKTR